jgi:hypothetical protein
MASYQPTEVNELLAEHPGYDCLPTGSCLLPALEDPYPEQTLLLFQLWSLMRPHLGIRKGYPMFLGPPENFKSISDFFALIGPILVCDLVFYSLSSLFNIRRLNTVICLMSN